MTDDHLQNKLMTLRVGILGERDLDSKSAGSERALFLSSNLYEHPITNAQIRKIPLTLARSAWALSEPYP